MIRGYSLISSLQSHSGGKILVLFPGWCCNRYQDSRHFKRSASEVDYVDSRRVVAKDALQKWLKTIPDTVYHGIIQEDTPSIALALSGGNFRAALFNAAALEAFDSRNGTSISKGLDGLLQSSTYMSALSGYVDG